MSAHQSKPIVVIVCPESGDDREGVRGRQVTLPLTVRRGGAKQPNTLSLHLSTERRTGIAPVKNIGRSFKATGWLNTRTSRTQVCQDIIRAVRKSNHFVSPAFASELHPQDARKDRQGVVNRTQELVEARQGHE